MRLSADQQTMIQFTAIAIGVGIFTRLLLSFLPIINTLPNEVKLILSVIAGCMAGWYLLYRNKAY